MELSLPKRDLSRLLARAASVAAVRSPIQALTGVLLEASSASLSARATDTFVGVEAACAAAIKADGTVAADARRLAEICRSLPEGEVTLKLVGKLLEVRTGRSRFKVAVLEAAEFPALPALAAADAVASLPASELLRCLAQGGYAMGGEARPETQCVLIEATGKTLRVVSQDGLRLAMSTLELVCKPATLYLSSRAVTELRKLCEAHKASEIRIMATDRVAFFATADGGVVLSARLQERTPPAYHKFIPSAYEQHVTCNQDTLLAAIRRVTISAAAADGVAVRMAFRSDGALRLSAEDATSEADDVIACDSSFALCVTINPHFLADAVAAVDGDEVRLELSGPTGPVVVVPAASADCKGLITSMRRK